jgi:hypothetical protein
MTFGLVVQKFLNIEWLFHGLLSSKVCSASLHSLYKDLSCNIKTPKCVVLLPLGMNRKESFKEENMQTSHAG